MSTIAGYKVHPAAELFPLMSKEELKALAASITKNGMDYPVTLTSKNEVIDGRNRLLACEQIGRKPIFETKDPEDPIGFVCARNLDRRHLNQGQKAAISLEVEKQYAEQIKEKERHRKSGDDDLAGTGLVTKGGAAEKAAKALGVGKTSVKNAKRVAKENPALLADVKSGKTSLDKAVKSLGPAAKKKRKERKPPKPQLDRAFTTCLQMIEGAVGGLTKHFARAKEEGKDYSKWIKALEKQRTNISSLINVYTGRRGKGR